MNTPVEKDKKDKPNSIQSKIKKFEAKVAKTQNFIDNHKKVSEDEAELIKLSFETLLSFIDNKSKEL